MKAKNRVPRIFFKTRGPGAGLHDITQRKYNVLNTQCHSYIKLHWSALPETEAEALRSYINNENRKRKVCLRRRVGRFTGRFIRLPRRGSPRDEGDCWRSRLRRFSIGRFLRFWWRAFHWSRRGRSRKVNRSRYFIVRYLKIVDQHDARCNYFFNLSRGFKITKRDQDLCLRVRWLN